VRGLDRALRAVGCLVGEGHFQLGRERFAQLHGLRPVDDDALELGCADHRPAGMEAHFGFLAAVVGLDNPTSTLVTRRVLGWEPAHPGLLADFDDGDYFAMPQPQE
jgi:hypothetical protein